MALPPRKKIGSPVPKAAPKPGPAAAPGPAGAPRPAAPKPVAPKRAAAKSGKLDKPASGRLKGRKPSGRQEGGDSGRTAMAMSSQRGQKAKQPVWLFVGVGVLILGSIILFALSANRPDKIITRDDPETLKQAKALFGEFKQIKSRFDKAETDAAKNAAYKEAERVKEAMDNKYRELYRLYGTGNNEDPLDNRLPPEYLHLEEDLGQVAQLFYDMMKRNPVGSGH